MVRRLLSLFLFIIMLICLLPIPAGAENKYDIKPQFEDARYFSEGLAAVKKNGKWGFIDKTGKVVIDYQFDGADKNGFHEGLAGVKVGSKYGFIGRNGKMVIQPQFNYVFSGFDDGVAKTFDIDLDKYEASGSLASIDRYGNTPGFQSERTTLFFSEGMRAVKINGKYGFEDEAGNIAITPQFEAVFPFKDGLAPVAIMVNNDIKWGYVDKTGKLIIKPQYEFLPSMLDGDPISADGVIFFDGMAVIQDSDTLLYGAIDKSGNQVIPPKYLKMRNYGDGLFGVCDENGYGYIDKSGNEILPHVYEYALEFKSGLAFVMIINYTRDGEGYVVDAKDEQYFIDKSGNLVIKLQYDDVRSFIGNVAPVCKDGKWGLIDKTGKEIVKPQYFEIEEYKYNPDYLEVTVFGEGPSLHGILDKNGKEILKPIYTNISEYKFDPKYFQVEDPAIGLFDRNGNEVVKTLYSRIYEYGNLFITDMDIITKSGVKLLERDDSSLSSWCDDGNIILSSDLDKNIFALIDAKSAKVLCKAEYINDLSEGLASVCTGGKWGFIDKTGSFVIKPQSGYKKIDNFHNGLARVVDNNGKCGFMDKTGKVAIKVQYPYASDFSEGLAEVEKNKKSGYIDTKGNEVIKAIYDEAGHFENGVAVVERNKKSGLIDKKGNEITKLQYDDMDYDWNNNLFYVEKSGKHGVIDLTGKEVVPVQYEDIDFSRETGTILSPTDSTIYQEGMLKVKLNGKWGFLADPGNIPDSTYQEQVNQAISAKVIPENLQYGYKDKIYATKIVKLVSAFVENKYGKSIFSLLMEKGMNTDNRTEAYWFDRRSTALYKLGILQDNIGGFGMQYFIGSWVATHEGTGNGFLTREQAAILLANTARFCGADVTSPKSSASDYSTLSTDSRKAVDFVVSKGIMSLKQNNEFDPKGTVTMQEACTFILNLNNLLK